MAFEEKMEVIESIEHHVGQFIDEKMKDPEDCWQPSDFLPDFSDRGSLFSPGRGAVEFLNSCFNLPSGEIAEFVGWMSAQLKLESLAKVCSGLAEADFASGVSTTKEPADID